MFELFLRQRINTLKRKSLFCDEEGLTTTGVVLALLISLSLIFSAAQIYRINSVAAEVQDIADAAALAAENQVAEFMLVARLCDAIILSLSLTGVVVCGLGIAALCTPVTASASEKLLEAGHKIFKTRNDFARKAAQGLNRIQELLPYFAAARAAHVAYLNNVASDGSYYVGIAILVASEGDALDIKIDDGLDEVLNRADENADDIRSLSAEADEKAQEAESSKERAFAHDCGNNPSYCLYERAASLAKLTGVNNPFYVSVDTWSFSVPLERTRAYYAARLALEAPKDSSVAEGARSAVRTQFYHFACEQMEEAYVHETADSFDAYFPRLPRNTDEMRSTVLYTEEIWPVSYDEEGQAVMHAWSGCPNLTSISQVGSLSDMERGDYPTCPQCEFTPASMGKVAAASTSIENGYEFHYRVIADEAEAYQRAREELNPLNAEVKEQVGGLFDDLAEVLTAITGTRIHPKPPGSYGAIALVANIGNNLDAPHFASLFVNTVGALGPRVAVAAATLLEEESDEGRTVLNSLLDGFREESGAAAGVVGIVLDCWSALLGAYTTGHDALIETIEKGLDALPLVGASGLGTWASDTLRSLIEGVGLEPAKMQALKPVLVNSGHVATKDTTSIASGYLQVKQYVISYPLASTDLFSSFLTAAENRTLDTVGNIGDTLTIASIELFGEYGPSIPLEIPVPDAIRQATVAFVRTSFAELRSLYVEVTGVRIWE